MASHVASKRLFQEYKNLTNDPPDGITAGPANEDDIFLWEALIQGPEGTPFEGGIFPAELKFPKDYPLAPPTMKFTCEMWHPNGGSGAFNPSLSLRRGVQVLFAEYYTDIMFPDCSISHWPRLHIHPARTGR